MSRPPAPRRRRGRFIALTVLVAIVVQVPLVLALGRLIGQRGVVWGVAAALTSAFVAGFLMPGRSVWGAPRRLRLYLILWPFFIWWTMALMFALSVPLAFAITAGLGASTNAALAGAAAVAAVTTALSLRQRPRLRRHDIVIPSLPAAFDGYRIVQISDLHCGPFAPRERIDAWVATVNALDADLVAVTGDLIASGEEFVPVVAESLSVLRARDGVFASMGNHDYFTEGADLAAALVSAGLRVLRNEGVEVRRGDAGIYVAGVDDTWTRRDDMARALSGRPSGMPALVLAHDPALFPAAAALGADLTLSGHTHGGQLGLPLFARRLNLARVMTPFTNGLYRAGASTLYVNRGLGTTGPPVRLGVPPEIAVLTLRRTIRGERAQRSTMVSGSSPR